MLLYKNIIYIAQLYFLCYNRNIKLKEEVMFTDIFKNAEAIPEKLLKYGFCKDNNRYNFETDILNGNFKLIITISDDKIIATRLYDTDTDEEYTLYKTGAEGSFVGDVRQAISDILTDVRDKCCRITSFVQQQTERMAQYAHITYGDSPEYLWKDSDSCILRRKDSGKWYAAVMTVEKRKLGIDSDGIAEIVDLHSDKVDALLGNPAIYKGWHMNKKYWVTVVLDDSLKDKELFHLLDESYRLAKK